MPAFSISRSFEAVNEGDCFDPAATLNIAAGSQLRCLVAPECFGSPLRWHSRLRGVGGHASLLPPSWMTLYDITRLNDDQFEAAVSGSIINPSMDRVDLKHWLKAERRVARHKAIAAAAAATKASPRVI